VGTLYIACQSAGEPDDIPFRMQRILGEVSLVVAVDPDCACRWLDRNKIPGTVAGTSSLASITSTLNGGDAALLLEGWLSCPSASEIAVIQAAIEGGHRVVALPGPSLPIAALVASGLPADSFVYLGELPAQPVERRSLLAQVAGERRTLLAIQSSQGLPELLNDLCGALGDRPLALAAASDRGLDEIWRGTFQNALDLEHGLAQQDRCVLVIGGARGPTARWDEERLRAGIRASLNRGLGVKATSRQLADESGWPRRDVYEMAVEIDRFLAKDQVW
jgi:16S rRNA (cytidine1402-2'-O)-methyltransferase